MVSTNWNYFLVLGPCLPCKRRKWYGIVQHNGQLIFGATCCLLLFERCWHSATFVFDCLIVQRKMSPANHYIRWDPPTTFAPRNLVNGIEQGTRHVQFCWATIDDCHRRGGGERLFPLFAFDNVVVGLVCYWYAVAAIKADFGRWGIRLGCSGRGWRGHKRHVEIFGR